jgi:hypothetical protein
MHQSFVRKAILFAYCAAVTRVATNVRRACAASNNNAAA